MRTGIASGAVTNREANFPHSYVSLFFYSTELIDDASSVRLLDNIGPWSL